jgi:hypothetical protein
MEHVTRMEKNRNAYASDGEICRRCWENSSVVLNLCILFLDS